MFKHVAAVGKSNARKDQVAPFDDGKGGQQGLLPLAPVSSMRPIWVTDQDLETAEREVIAYAQRNGIRLPDDPAQAAVAAARHVESMADICEPNTEWGTLADVAA